MPTGEQMLQTHLGGFAQPPAPISTAPTPLQRARTVAAQAHSHRFHARIPPQHGRKRRRGPDPAAQTNAQPSHGGHSADKETQVWEDQVLGRPSSPLDLQRYLAHSQSMCAQAVHRMASGGRPTPGPPNDPRLVPIAGVDCLNMAKDPKGMRESLVLHFYPHFFKIDSQPFVHDYNRTNRQLLLAIHRGKLPVRLLNEKQCAYYNGCVLVELRDYRGAVRRQQSQAGGQSPATQQHKLVVSRVLLQPCIDTIIDDLVRTRTRSVQARLLSIRDLIEAEKFLVNGSQSLCLDPSPRVAAAAGAMHYNAHKFDEVMEQLSPLLPPSYAETTYRESKMRRQGGGDAGGHGARVSMRRAVVGNIRLGGGGEPKLDWSTGQLIRPNLELLSGLSADTGSGLPHGAVVLLNQALYTSRQWSDAEASFVPYQSAPAQGDKPLVASPADCVTPEQILVNSATDAHGGVSRARRHLREQHYTNREENHFYIIDLVQNVDKSFECIIRCGPSLRVCSAPDAEMHAVQMPSLEALYNFARQFARLKQTEGCICTYDSMDERC